MNGRHVWRGGVCGLLLFTVVPLAGAFGRDYSVFYAFKGGADGESPWAGVVTDKQCNLYGTTSLGGGSDQCNNGGVGCGTVFKLAPDGTETVLYAFTGGSDGARPRNGLTRDNAGNLYGAAGFGGKTKCQPGCGTVFRLAANGTFAVLHAFRDGVDGANPESELLGARHGAYFGTAASPLGTVYRFSGTGKLNVLYTFLGGKDGAGPSGKLIADAEGNLYGTTGGGGADDDGTVFRLMPDGTETVLHAFDGSDGASPGAGVVMDGTGNLYGTTGVGGGGCYQVDEGCGTLFKLAPDGSVTILHNFDGGDDGGLPNGLLIDGKGNLYGTTMLGGDSNCDCGTVFMLAPGGAFKVLHTFVGGSDGGQPLAALTQGLDGYLYGTASGGQFACVEGCGTVFRIKP
jgi:uncharacterized repeat protein (TIGR03803 family)